MTCPMFPIVCLVIWLRRGKDENSVFFDNSLNKVITLRTRCKVTVLFDDVVDLKTDILRLVFAQVHLRGNDETGVGHTKEIISQKFL